MNGVRVEFRPAPSIGGSLRGNSTLTPFIPEMKKARERAFSFAGVPDQRCVTRSDFWLANHSARSSISLAESVAAKPFMIALLRLPVL